MGSLGASKQSGGSKAFSEMNVSEKREAIKAFEKSLDERYKSYDVGKYKIYKIDAGSYAAYQFKDLKDDFIKKATNTSYMAVDYDKTLKGLKARLGG